MSEPMTEAERAVAAMLTLDTELDPSIGVAGFNALAHRVVAAVRPILASEALERFADKVDALPPANEPRDGAYWHHDGLRGAAALAREEAAALRTTTPEKES
jgi:hypothetical protein